MDKKYPKHVDLLWDTTYIKKIMDTSIRQFSTGATRDSDSGKPDYEGFLSPFVVKRYGEFMGKNRVQKDGSVRYGDNWQKGIPLNAYMKSGWRHFHDWWMGHRGGVPVETVEDSLCALIFNASGYLYELLKERNYSRPDAPR